MIKEEGNMYMDCLKIYYYKKSYLIKRGSENRISLRYFDKNILIIFL